MAQLLIAGAMSAAGSSIITGTVLGMTGAQIGWMAGSLLASQLFKPPPQEGPRIEDKKVTSTIYGQPMPYVWGTDRCKAQILWASELIEASEEVGGKGGGGATMYSYSANLLLAVCKSPFGEPRTALRIWANGRLVATWNGMQWDVDGELIHRSRVRQYDGNALQMPDPVYEAAVGSANAPAYRGQLTIMLEGLQLGFSGNRVPNFEVEVTSNISTEDCPDTPLLTTLPGQPLIFAANGSQNRFSAGYDPVTRRYFVLTRSSNAFGASHHIEVYNIRQGLAPALARVIPVLGGADPSVTFGGTVIDPENRVLWVVFGTNERLRDIGPLAIRVSLDTLVFQESDGRLSSWTEPRGGICGSPTVYCPSILRQWGSYSTPSTTGGDGRDGGTGANYGAMLRVHPNSGMPRGEVSWGIDGSAIIGYRMTRLRNGEATLIHVMPCPICIGYHEEQGMGWHEPTAAGASNWTMDILYVPLPDPAEPPASSWHGGINYQLIYDGRGQQVTMIDEESATEVTGGTPALGFGATAVFSRSRRKVFVLNGQDVAVINLAAMGGHRTVFESDFAPVASIPANYHRAVWSEYLDALVLIWNGSSTTVTVVDPETDAVIAGPCVYPWHGTFDGFWSAINEVGGGWFVAIGHAAIPGANPDRVVMFKAPGSTALGGGVTLGKIVDDICGWVGLATDTTALPDIVDGYTLARQTAARGAIDPLRQGWFFYGVESGLDFVWRKRGQTEVMTIDSGDLGARIFETTQTDPPIPYEIEHPDETDPPRRLTVEFIDAAANYDPGTQTATRQATGAIAETRINLPVVMSPDRASMIAWVQMLLAHAGARPIKFSLPHRYEAIEPGDAVLMPVGTEIQRVVIVDRGSARPMLEFSAVIEDPAAWDAVFPGIPRGQGPQQITPAEIVMSILALLDVPPLRPSDDVPLLYAGVAGVDPGWSSAVVHRSSDGVNYSPVYSTGSQATIGYLTTALPRDAVGNVWDYETRFRVVLLGGTLSSATKLAVLNGANAAAVAGEIIQFVDAVNIGGNEWEVSTLLRGRVGTDYADNGHPAGTTFVLLDVASLRVIEYPIGDIGALRRFKAVSAGQTLSEAVPESITPNGNTIRPLAPVHVRGERDGSNNLTITWVRRARLNAAWLDEIDVPLDEPVEQWQVVVVDGSNFVIRAINTTAPTAVYSAADQATDGFTPGDPITVTVHQISSRVGRGHGRVATL